MLDRGLRERRATPMYSPQDTLMTHASLLGLVVQRFPLKFEVEERALKAPRRTRHLAEGRP